VVLSTTRLKRSVLGVSVAYSRFKTFPGLTVAYFALCAMVVLWGICMLCSTVTALAMVAVHKIKWKLTWYR